MTAPMDREGIEKLIDAAAIQNGEVGSLLNLVGPDRIRDAQRHAVEGSRLKIPLFFSLDVLHGLRTMFPIPFGESAAFDPALWEATARVAAEECGVEGIDLTFAPMIDIARDPRWGRTLEGPGEDPLGGQRLARAKVRGYQTANLASPTAIAATAKHFAGYGAVQAGREYASVDMSVAARSLPAAVQGGGRGRRGLHHAGLHRSQRHADVDQQAAPARPGSRALGL